MNCIRTEFPLAGMTGFFLAAGFMLDGERGVLLTLVIACGMNLYTYWNSDNTVLRMYGAQQVNEQSATKLFRLVEQLAKCTERPMPKVFIIEDNQPNAFATGRNPENALVAATTSQLGNLSQEESVEVMAPAGAMNVQMAIGRAREYEADRIGAEKCGRPLWLTSVLSKLE